MSEINDNLMVQASVKIEEQRRQIATLREENDDLLLNADRREKHRNNLFEKIVSLRTDLSALRAENERLRATLKSASADVQIMADGLGRSLRAGQLRTIVRRIGEALSEPAQ